jgi:hypothetical protein
MDMRLDFRDQKPDFGSRCIAHVGKHSYGFVDNYFSPVEGVSFKRFTMVLVGPAGHFNSPVSASVCAALSIAMPLGLIFALLIVRLRRTRVTRSPARAI